MLQGDSNLEISTGKFAELCQITKDTLFHYDELGLICPKRNLKNNYNRYSLSQIYLYHSIRILKNNGCTLPEIRSFIQETNPELLLSSIREYRNQIRKQNLSNIQTISFLDTAIQVNEALSKLHKASHKPRITSIKEAQNLLITPIEYKKKTSKSSFLDTLGTHIRRCEDIGVYPLPFGTVIPEESIVNQSYRPASIFSKISPNLPGVIATKREAGLYVTKLVPGTLTRNADSYHEILHFLKENRLTACGPLYETDLSAYLLSDDKDPLVHLSIEVTF